MTCREARDSFGTREGGIRKSLCKTLCKGLCKREGEKGRVDRSD